MNATVLIVLLAVAGATLPLVLEARRARSAFVRRAAPVAWLVGALALGVLAREGTPPWELRTLDERPLAAPTDGYVSSSACRACHPGEYDSWHDTYHRTMAQTALAGSVRAPFDGRVLADGLAERGKLVPFRRGDEFWVALPDPYAEGPAPDVERRVVQVTGSHHQQLYWFATGHTRALGLFPYGYRIDEERWLPVDAMFLTPPRGAQSRILGRWNSSCSRCHATHTQPRFEAASQMDTRVTELGIACEMCHGPGAEHVAANRDPLRRYALHSDEQGDATIVDPAELDVVRSTQVCGQCHGITHLPTKEARQAWNHDGYSFRPGDDLTATRALSEPDADAAERKLWSDGQLRVTGREYTALQRTPCFQAGAMSCLACHRLHQASDDPRPRDEWRNDLLAPGMDGDRACTQCHQQFAAPSALTAHSHHGADSSGSRCLDCHMPYTSYGLMGGIRSHDVEPPTVQASLATGRPNACNQCHLDQSLAWSAHWLAEWYGTPEPPLEPAQRELAASVLWATQGDAGQRALMAWSFGWEPALAAAGRDWRLPYLTLLMNDPYHVVRFIAGRSARSAPEFAGVSYDHLAANEERLGVTSELLQRWQSARAADEPARAALLLDAGGVWREDEVQRLLQQRDNSDMVLQE
ncbi:MAG: C cytochrome precursor [Planctomycetes bacterium]|nr:C cytochrome precursor [Planctomycetota bacterium]